MHYRHVGAMTAASVPRCIPAVTAAVFVIVVVALCSIRHVPRVTSFTSPNLSLQMLPPPEHLQEQQRSSSLVLPTMRRRRRQQQQQQSPRVLGVVSPRTATNLYTTKEAEQEPQPARGTTRSASLLSGKYDGDDDRRESASSSPVEQVSSSDDRWKGLLVLSTVPMVWGTYVPVVRSMYGVNPPIPGLVFSASYLTLASLSCLALAPFQKNPKPNSEQGEDGGKSESGEKDSESSSDPNLLLGGLELGLYTFLANSLQVVGLETVNSGRAGFLIQRKFRFTNFLVNAGRCLADK